MVAVDVIRTPADADLATRLLGISEAIEGWLEQTRPDVVAVERVFSQNNVATVMGTAQAAGVAVLAAARFGIPVVLHTPSEVKAAVTGSGRAGKVQVANMVTRILGLPARPRPADAADALALAICHLWRDGTSLIGAASAGAGAGGPTPAQRAWVEASQAAQAVTRAAGRSQSRPVAGPARRAPDPRAHR
jgi:crossover junction endodeoxyribonuclease RuvC